MFNFIEIESIEEYGEEYGEELVFDIEVEEDHSYIANGMVIHNCYDPNFQQFPADRTDAGKLFKKVLKTPGPDFHKFKLDYSGFQVRIAGIFSNDENLIDAFKNKGGDVHSMVAQIIYCRDLTLEQFMRMKKESPYVHFRHKSKFIVFGYLFGMVSKSFGVRLKDEWSEEDLQEFIQKNNPPEVGDEDDWFRVADFIRKNFFRLFSKLEPWFEDFKNKAKQNGYIDTIHGGRRHLPYLTYRGRNTDNKKYFNYLNISINSPVQGFEALTVYKGMAEIQKRIEENNLQSYMCGMTHDSLEGFYHKDEKEIMEKILKESCEDLTTYSIPLTIDLEM